MDKLNFKSRDLAADNIEKLAALFPSAITELRGEDGELRPSQPPDDEKR